MALTIKHNKQTAIADDPAKDVSASEWNDAHGVTGVLDVANGGTGSTAGAVLKTGDQTMTGNLTVNSVNIGSVTTGYYGDAANLAIRTNGTLYFQTAGGAATNATLSTGGLSLGTTLTSNGLHQANGPTTLVSTGTYASDTVSQIQIYGGNAYPTIAFHSVGYFGANFGMSTNGNFYMGGWSHGNGTAYQFWTSRDGYPIIYTRWVYAGDTNGSEIWGSSLTNAAVTCTVTTGGGEYGGWVNSVSVYMTNRHRYLQVWTANVGDYSTVGWAS